MSDLRTALHESADVVVARLDHGQLRRRAARRTRARHAAAAVAAAAIIVGLVAVVPSPAPPAPEVIGVTGPTDEWDGRLTAPPLPDEPDDFQRYIHVDEFTRVVRDCAAGAGITLTVVGDAELQYAQAGEPPIEEVSAIVDRCRRRYPVARGVPAPTTDPPAGGPPLNRHELEVAGWTARSPADPFAVEQWVHASVAPQVLVACLEARGVPATITGGGVEFATTDAAAYDECDARIASVRSSVPLEEVVAAGPAVEGTPTAAMVRCLEESGFAAVATVDAVDIAVEPTGSPSETSRLVTAVEGCSERVAGR